MKRNFYLLVIFFVVAQICQAQIKKGDILLGGNIGFYTQKTTPSNPAGGYSNTQISLTPSYGKAISDNLVVGFDLAYFYSNGKTDYTGFNPAQIITDNVRNYGAGFFVRRYKYLGNGFSLFLQSRLGATYITTKNTYGNIGQPDADIKGYTISLGFYPGLSYSISKRVQLETGFQNLASVQYTHQKQTNFPMGGPYTDYKTNVFSVGTSLDNSLFGFVVGVRILMGGS